MPAMNRRRVHEILRGTRSGDQVARWVGLLILSLIALNVLVIVVESTEEVATPADLPPFYLWFEWCSVAVFSVEYLLRVWSSPEDARFAGRGLPRLRFALTPMALVDLLAVLPFYLGLLGLGGVDLRVVRVLRMFRLFRILKLGRYSVAMQNIGEALRARRGELGFAVFVILVLLLLASTLMYLVEQPHQPDRFGSIPAAMWWGIATLTTVGYGDLVPVTAVGRVLGAVIAVLGIGIFALPAGILAGALNEAVGRRRAEAVGPPCPHCGRPLPGDQGGTPADRS